MAETVAGFTQKSYKKYACGRAAQKAKKTLTKAFTASDAKNAVKEEILFEEIIDSVMKTKKGRETLTTLSKLGYSFAFEKGNFGGFCAPNQKKVVINPSFGFEYMLQTAVHEGRHAIQYSLESENRPNYEHTQVASSLRMHRAIEADAVAHEMAFVYECRQVMPNVYEKAKETGLPMFHAYVGEMEKSHDERKAMQACFAAWYECDYYRDYYDKWHKDGFKRIAEYAKEEKDPDCFSKEYPAADVLKMCCYKGKPYMTADDLNSGRPFSIKQSDQKEISAMIDDYAASVPGAKPDRSVQLMCPRNEKGELTAPSGKSGNKQAVVSAALSQRGR